MPDHDLCTALGQLLLEVLGWWKGEAPRDLSPASGRGQDLLVFLDMWEEPRSPFCLAFGPRCSGHRHGKHWWEGIGTQEKGRGTHSVWLLPWMRRAKCGIWENLESDLESWGRAMWAWCCLACGSVAFPMHAS